MDSDYRIDLPPEEWDFREIPKAEFGVASIYEYSRGVPEVRRRVEEWLESDFQLIGDGGEGRDELVSQGMSFRESFVARASGKISICFDAEWAPYDILDHEIWSIRTILMDWPEPYVTARKSTLVSACIEGLVKFGIDEKKQRTTAFWPCGMLRSSDSEPWQLPNPEGVTVSGWENLDRLPTYGFHIDMTSTRKEIEKSFKEWLAVEHEKVREAHQKTMKVRNARQKATKSSRGRKKGKRVPLSDLKAISALRLSQRGQKNRPKAYRWVNDVVRSILDQEGFSPGEGCPLPLYDSQKGFDEAIERAQIIKREMGI